MTESTDQWARYNLKGDQLDALFSPWEKPGELDGLALLEDAAQTSRPVSRDHTHLPSLDSKVCEIGRVSGWVITQRLKSGNHRVLFFDQDGKCRDGFTHERASAVQRWVENSTKHL